MSDNGEHVNPSDHTESGRILGDRDGDLWYCNRGSWWPRGCDDWRHNGGDGPSIEGSPFTVYAGEAKPPGGSK